MGVSDVSRPPKTMIIANPASANGRTGRNWDRIYPRMKENFRGSFDLEMTQHRGHATELSRHAMKSGYELVVALGGDGTVNEVLNGFFGETGPINTGAAFGFLPLGTGNDMRRNLGIPGEFSAALRALGEGIARRVDVGKVVASEHADTSSGSPEPTEARYFLNVADFGSGGVIADKMNRTTKAFGAQASLLWSLVSTLASYKNPTVTFSVDGEEEQVSIINDFVVANGKYFGAGIKAAPDARMDDGLFDIVILGDFGFAESLLNFPRLRRGTHLTHPKVRSRRGKRITAIAGSPVLVEADGQVIGFLPATFEIMPQALLVK